MRKRTMSLLFVVLFLASFDMHAQMPLLAPYTASLGASSMFIGVLLSAYSMSNLMGNLVAGPFLDRYSKKGFISSGLALAGCLLIAHGYIEKAEGLLPIRLVYGFVMAFVTPASFALLGKLASSPEEQGRLMAKNGINLTIASIISPIAGGFLASSYGYANAFSIFGGVMLFASLLVWSMLPSARQEIRSKQENLSAKQGFFFSLQQTLSNPALYSPYLCGFALMYVQGTILYEIPLMVHYRNLDPDVTGKLFSFMGVGSLSVLLQFWLQRTSAHLRCVIGLFQLGLVAYAMAIGYEVSLHIVMVVAGASFGLLFPAMTTILTQDSPETSYGSTFSLFSAVLSVGAFVGPIVAGMLKNSHHSFFVSFGLLTLASMICLLLNNKKNRTTSPVSN